MGRWETGGRPCALAGLAAEGIACAASRRAAYDPRSGRAADGHCPAAGRWRGGGAVGTLWDKQAGQESRAALEALTTHGGLAGPLTFADATSLIKRHIQDMQVRDYVTPHPNIRIYGTLESRVQGADITILAGLNDGTWPPILEPDPWLNRAMRKAAGLRLPERRVGLSAHDFLQGRVGAGSLDHP